MADSEEILGTTKITDRWRISLIKAVRDELEADEEPIEIGDRIVFKRRRDAVVIETA